MMKLICAALLCAVAALAQQSTDLRVTGPSVFTGGVDMTGATSIKAVATNAQTGTTYTLAASDCGKLVTFANASPVAVTIPAASTPGAGCSMRIRNNGTGAVTLTSATSALNGTVGGSIALLTGYSVELFTNGTAYWTAAYTRVNFGAGFSAAARNPVTGEIDVSATQDSVQVPYNNDGTTGTTQYRLTTTNSAGNAIIASTSDTSGIVGVAETNAGTAGTVMVRQLGRVLLRSEGNTTARHFIGISSTTAGAGTSSATCPSGQVIGIWDQTGTGAADRYAIIAPGICAAAGGGGSAWGNFSLVQPAATATTCATSMTALGSVSITGIGSTGTIEFEAMVQKASGNTDSFELQALFDGNDVGDINDSGAPVTHGANDAVGILHGTLNLTGSGTVVSLVKTTREGGSPNVYRYRLRTLTPGATSTLQILARCSGTSDTMRLVYLNARRIP